MGGCPDDAWISEPAVPVIAHELLASMGSIRSTVRALAQRGDTVDAVERARILLLVDRRAEHVTAVLRDLVRGLTAEAVQALIRDRTAREDPGPLRQGP